MFAGFAVPVVEYSVLRSAFEQIETAVVFAEIFAEVAQVSG